MRKRKLFITSLLIIIFIIIFIISLFVPNKFSPEKINNIDIVKHLCNTACSTNSSLDYCLKLRVVNDEKTLQFEETCYNLATKEKYSKRNYEISICPQINCSE